MIWCFSFQEQKSATLPMIQHYIHAHQILKRQLWNYLMRRVWFLIDLELIVWWQTLPNFRMCFLGQTLIITKLHSWKKIRVKSRSEGKLLAITIGDKLFFATHIENLLSSSKYSPLIWMFCNKAANNLINEIYKRSLRVFCEMEGVNFEDLWRIPLALFMKTIFRHC